MQGYRKRRRPSTWPLTGTGTCLVIIAISVFLIALLQLTR